MSIIVDIHQNPLALGFALPGRWFNTSVRVSFWFPLLGVVICFRLGLQLGLWVTCLLFGSILFHEFFHIFAARRTGGEGDEILMWPLGGLAFVTPAPTFFSEFWTAAAGPLANLVLCLATLPAVLSAGLFNESLQLVYLPSVSLSTSLGQSLLVLLFSLNFKLLILNLLPIYPLDGGQMSYTLAKLYWPRETAKIGSLWFGIIACVILSAAGLMFESTEILFVSFMLTFFCYQEYITTKMSPQFDESFMGYDFSQGYTSLERMDADLERPRPVLSPFERWKQNREQKRREKEQLQQLETERRVDELLDKVHREGMDALTDAERRFLKRASNRYKSQD